MVQIPENSMRNLDRLLGIIYKEASLHEYINIKLDTLSREMDCYCKEFFDLNSSFFRRKLIQSYLTKYPYNYNEDEIELLINDISSKIEGTINSNPSSNVANIFLYIAKNFLFLNGGRIRILFDYLLEWNGFINKVDANIIIAAKLALNSNFIDSNHHRVEHDNDRLLRILSSGIADNHMHLKASGYTPDMNWYEFSNSEKVVIKEFEQLIKDKRFFNITDEIISFYKIRYIKAFLFYRFVEQDNFFIERGSEDSERFYKELEISVSFMKNLIAYTDLETYEFLFLKNSDKLLFWQEMFKKRYCNHLDEDTRYFMSERLFLRDLFMKLLSNKMDNFSVYLFNVYLLASSKFKMFFCQDNEAMGFEKFKHIEKIKENLTTNDSDRHIFTTVFDKYYKEKNVKKIEFRIAPKKDTSTYVRLINDVKSAEEKVSKKLRIDEKDRIQYGFIVHYIKDKKEFNEEDGISRKEKTIERINSASNALISFFNSKSFYPYDTMSSSSDDYRSKIIGIDAANYEMNCRPDNFAYAFRRQKLEISSSHMLKFTYHVGEDFTALPNGLRAIDEVIEFLNFGRGDRLGHALALGIDVDRFFETKRRMIISSVEDYLDDIVWMKYLIQGQDSIDINHNILDKRYSISEILCFLDNEFNKYFKLYYVDRIKITEDAYDIYDYYSAYHLRGDHPFIYGEIYEIYERFKRDNSYDVDQFYQYVISKFREKLNSDNAGHREAFLNHKARDLFFRYHYSSSVKQLHNKILTLNADPLYIEAVRISQYVLRKKIYDLEIAIESNPSSNIKISSVFKYIDLPFFQLNQLYKDNPSSHNLPTCINTDDSSIFQTDLSLEYAYVVAALMREGYDKERIYEYIEYMRNNSMIYSFVSE